MEEFLTSAIFSGIAYDIIKTSSYLTIDNLKVKAKGWLIDDKTGQKLVDEINQIENRDELNEKGLLKRIEANQDILDLLSSIKIDQSIKKVTQVHSGSGDNVAGDKIVTYNKDN